MLAAAAMVVAPDGVPEPARIGIGIGLVMMVFWSAETSPPRFDVGRRVALAAVSGVTAAAAAWLLRAFVFVSS